MTSLAIGADQLFAQVVLDLGGMLEAIIPFEGYQSKFGLGPDRENYERLLARAAKVTTLLPKETDELSYLEAGKLIVKSCDQLVAVWDGIEADGLGGTGDIVHFARKEKVPVVIISVTG